jgi:tetratricopeptide (TPR) repeat protein
MSRQIACVLSAVLLVSCATRRVPPRSAAEFSEALSLVRAGCYHCLQEALSTFERLASDPNARDGPTRAAFTTAVLLVVRSRELGLPDRAALERAHVLAGRLTPSAIDLPPAAYFNALRFIGGETSGFSPEQREQRAIERRSLRTSDGTVPPARAALSSAVETDMVAQYLALTLDCEDAQAPKSLDATAIGLRYPVPLIQFRLALCSQAAEPLRQLREGDARWIDTAFFEGTREMVRYPAPDVARAAELFALGHDAFPESSAITLSLANARNALGEFESALALFDSVLATETGHRDALLGRLLSLSYLGRPGDAINTATQLVDLGMFHQGEAFYWRAWNKYRIQELPGAWQDITQATALMVNTAVYTLAGFIAYARGWPETAINRLAEAYRLDSTNCEAVWTEALVHVDKEDWPPASSRFATAAGCFGQSAEEARKEIARVETSDLADAVKGRRMAAARKRVDTAEHRQAEAALNAAGSYARLGNKADAINYVEMAARHPLLKAKAEALRASLDKRQ